MIKQPLTYPSPQDLEFILCSCVRKCDLLTFLRNRSIFLFNATIEEVAKEVARYLYSTDALEELRALAYRSSNNKILSGFQLSGDKGFALDQIYNDARNNGFLSSKGYRLNSIAKVTTSEGVYFEGTLSYLRQSAGRINFIRTEERDVAFKMHQLSDSEWQVEVDGAKSNDGKTVMTMLADIAKKRGIETRSLRIDRLTNGDTISFFDKLATEGLSKEWKIVDIGRINIKREAGAKVDEFDEDEREVEQEQLSGITNAILEGKNLREHQFVRNAENSGYAFTSMTYIFHNNKSDEKIKIRAEFKGSPKIFEVALESYTIGAAIDSEDDNQLSILDDKVNLRLRSEFWNNSCTIFKEICNQTSMNLTSQN